jgi:NADPH:quinone reductase-like Zn-dependent oxidoreductase
MTQATLATSQPDTGTTMRAWVQEGEGTADVLQLREIPRPAITPDQVLVRVRATSINAADYHTVHGVKMANLFGKLLRMPPAGPIRGSDLSGTVVAVGANVTAMREGDEVYGMAPGAWAEYAVGGEKGLLAKPAGLSHIEAACMGVAPLTALQGLRDHGGLRSGSRALIYGAGGGVGTFAVQIAKALGAHVTAVTGPRTADIVSRLGPDEVVDYTKEDVLRRAARYDVIYDVAAIAPIGRLRGALAPGGRLVLAGASKRGGMAIFQRLIAGQLRARIFKQPIVFYIAKRRTEDLIFLRSLVEQGRLRPAVERTYPFPELREGVRYTMTGQARAKVVIDVG